MYALQLRKIVSIALTHFHFKRKFKRKGKVQSIRGERCEGSKTFLPYQQILIRSQIGSKTYINFLKA